MLEEVIRGQLVDGRGHALLYHFESLQEQTTFVESGRTNKSRRRLARRRQIVTLWRWVMACRNAPVTSVPGLVSGGF